MFYALSSPTFFEGLLISLFFFAQRHSLKTPSILFDDISFFILLNFLLKFVKGCKEFAM